MNIEIFGKARRLGRRALAALVVPLLFTTGAAAQGTTRITVAVLPVTEFLPLYVAIENGYMASRGISVDLVPIRFMPDIAGAVFSGAAQFGSHTGSGFVQAVQGGLDMVAVAGAARFTARTPLAALLTRPGAGITSAADLRGKRIAVPGFGSLLDVLFRNWLLQKGIALNEVQLVEGVNPQMADLLRSGAVHAVATVEPFVTFVQESGSGVLASRFVAEVNPDIAATLYMAKRDWAEANRNTVRGFTAALSEAVAFIAANPDRAREIERQRLRINIVTLPEYFVEITANDLNASARLMSNIGTPTEGFDASKAIFR